MTKQSVLVGVCLNEHHALELDSFATVCGTNVEFIRNLVEIDLLQPMTINGQWRFSGEALARARRIQRLQRDFEANLETVAVIIDLMDEIEQLQAQLRRAGISRDLNSVGPAMGHYSTALIRLPLFDLEALQVNLLEHMPP